VVSLFRHYDQNFARISHLIELNNPFYSVILMPSKISIYRIINMQDIGLQNEINVI
jgi:hypothetical protein